MSIVNLFVPCAMDMFSPLIPKSVISVLEKLGDTVIYHPEQTCCGRTLYYRGERDFAAELAKKMIDDLLDPQDIKRATIIPSTDCSAYIRRYFKELLSNTVVPSELNGFVQNVYDLSDYIVNVKGVNRLNNRFNARVYYFESCSARNLYKLEDEPQILLKNTEGLELITDETVNDCCPGNLFFANMNPTVADQIIEECVNRIYQLNVQYITSTDIECLQLMDAYIQTLNVNMEVIHIADIYNSEQAI